MRVCLLLLVLLPLVATPAAATLVVQVPGVPFAAPMNPQLTCAIVHDQAGESRCDAVGGVSNVRSVTVSSQGMSDLSILVVDEVSGRQLHSGPCIGTCHFETSVTSPRVRLAIFGHGVGPSAYAVATVHMSVRS